MVNRHPDATHTRDSDQHALHVKTKTRSHATIVDIRAISIKLVAAIAGAYPLRISYIRGSVASELRMIGTDTTSLREDLLTMLKPTDVSKTSDRVPVELPV
jgi:hypothetical protein